MAELEKSPLLKLGILAGAILAPAGAMLFGTQCHEDSSSTGPAVEAKTLINSEDISLTEATFNRDNITSQSDSDPITAHPPFATNNPINTAFDNFAEVLTEYRTLLTVLPAISSVDYKKLIDGYCVSPIANLDDKQSALFTPRLRPDGKLQTYPDALMLYRNWRAALPESFPGEHLSALKNAISSEGNELHRSHLIRFLGTHLETIPYAKDSVEVTDGIQSIIQFIDPNANIHGYPTPLIAHSSLTNRFNLESCISYANQNRDLSILRSVIAAVPEQVLSENLGFMLSEFDQTDDTKFKNEIITAITSECASSNRSISFRCIAFDECLRQDHGFRTNFESSIIALFNPSQLLKNGSADDARSVINSIGYLEAENAKLFINELKEIALKTESPIAIDAILTLANIPSGLTMAEAISMSSAQNVDPTTIIGAFLDRLDTDPLIADEFKALLEGRTDNPAIQELAIRAGLSELRGNEQGTKLVLDALATAPTEVFSPGLVKDLGQNFNRTNIPSGVLDKLQAVLQSTSDPVLKHQSFLALALSNDGSRLNQAEAIALTSGDQKLAEAAGISRAIINVKKYRDDSTPDEFIKSLTPSLYSADFLARFKNEPIPEGIDPTQAPLYRFASALLENTKHFGFDPRSRYEFMLQYHK